MVGEKIGRKERREIVCNENKRSNVETESFARILEIN